MSFAPDAARGLRSIFVHGLIVQARLGVHPKERLRTQRVVIDVDLAVRDEYAPDREGPDELTRVVDYAEIAVLAARIAQMKPMRLAETLAERIALAALADPRVVIARVTVRKPEALPAGATVGVVVERRRLVEAR